MASMKIKKGDMVKVIAGRDKYRKSPCRIARFRRREQGLFNGENRKISSRLHFRLVSP